MGAVWELVVADAAFELGPIAYEIATPGGVRPDWCLTLPTGRRVWLEAAFLRKVPSARPSHVTQHPVQRVLRRKARKASKTKLDDPFVVVIGSDRVQEIASKLLPHGLRSEEVAQRVFAGDPEERNTPTRSLSAVILVPILFRAAMFEGFARDAQPSMEVCQDCRYPLTEHELVLLNRFDFNRRTFSLFTETDRPRHSLRDSVNSTPTGAIGRQSTKTDRPRAAWSYCWRFSLLRIVHVGGKYWLYDRETVVAHGDDADELARTASELYCPYPKHVMTLEGIRLNPDKGVPSSLLDWCLELP